MTTTHTPGPWSILSSQVGSMKMREFKSEHGKVQIVQIGDTENCIVGYLPSKEGESWRHWGTGEGGYDATVSRFSDCPTFNPQTKKGKQEEA